MNKLTDKPQYTKHLETGSPNHFQSRENAAVYNNNYRQEIIDAKVYGNTELQRKRQSPPNNCKVPPPRGFFQRSRSRENSFRAVNTLRNHEPENCISPNTAKQPQMRAEYASKLTDLRKRLSLEIQEKEKLKQNVAEKEAKISVLGNQITKLKQQLKWFQQQFQKSSSLAEEKEKELVRTQLIIQNLNKVINANKSSKKQGKNVDSREDNLVSKIQKLIEENAELAKKIAELKLQNSAKKSQVIEQDKQINKETMYSLQLQVNRLKKQLQKDKSERQRQLQITLRELQSRLYEKQNDLRKNSVHMNLMGRKHTISIDEVRQKKDQQIKYLREKFIKVSRDLKQTKNKIQKNDKKKVEKDPISMKKVRSHKEIRFGSDTDDFTFELSSEV